MFCVRYVSSFTRMIAPSFSPSFYQNEASHTTVSSWPIVLNGVNMSRTCFFCVWPCWPNNAHNEFKWQSSVLLSSLTRLTQLSQAFALIRAGSTTAIANRWRHADDFHSTLTKLWKSIRRHFDKLMGCITFQLRFRVFATGLLRWVSLWLQRVALEYCSTSRSSTFRYAPFPGLSTLATPRCTCPVVCSLATCLWPGQSCEA